MEVSALWEQEQLRLPATRLSCERTNHSFPHGGPVLLTKWMNPAVPLKVGGACRFPRALTDSVLLTLSNNFLTRQTSLKVACSAMWPRCQVSIIPLLVFNLSQVFLACRVKLMSVRSLQHLPESNPQTGTLAWVLLIFLPVPLERAKVCPILHKSHWDNGTLWIINWPFCESLAVKAGWLAGWLLDWLDASFLRLQLVRKALKVLRAITSPPLLLVRE